MGVLLVETEGELPHLVGFMVDASHQRQGVGRQAAELLAERRCGFQDTGRRDWEGEPIFVLPLSPQS